MFPLNLTPRDWIALALGVGILAGGGSAGKAAGWALAARFAMTHAQWPVFPFEQQGQQQQQQLPPGQQPGGFQVFTAPPTGAPQGANN